MRTSQASGAVHPERTGRRDRTEAHIWEAHLIVAGPLIGCALEWCAGRTRVMTSVWIFHGRGAHFASGVFADKDSGMAWVARHGVTGILTEYPVGHGTYDFAVADGGFTPSLPEHGTPAHVALFLPGGDHEHVRDGVPDDNYGEA